MDINIKIRGGFKKAIECEEAAHAKVYTPVRGPTTDRSHDTKNSYIKR